MENVYFISGLGADERAFQFLDLSFCNPVFIKWITPVDGETMPAYAQRLTAQIKDPEPVVVGLSFGGMLAIEIGKQLKCRKIILISSSKGAKEIPFYLRSLRYIPLHKYITPSFLRKANEVAYKLMGVSNRKDKLIFSKMFRQADDRFVMWALDKIIHWRNTEVPENTYHIHGTHDLMLPYRFIKAHYVVKGAGHLMLLTRPAEISSLLRQIITGDYKALQAV